MKLFNVIKKLFALSNNTRRIRTAAAIACKEIASRVSAAPELPQYKTRIPVTTKSHVFPLPVVICGSMVHSRANFNTLANFGLISPMRPNPLIYVSSSKGHYTNIGIREHGYFSVNIPNTTVMIETDYLGVVSGKTIDKSKILNVFYGNNDYAPCLSECPLNYVCKVIEHLEIRDKDLFIGEIIESFVTEEFFQSGSIDIDRMKPLIYSIDNQYRVPGAPVGKAYDIYKEMEPGHEQN